jgi:hypothetical protein
VIRSFRQRGADLIAAVAQSDKPMSSTQKPFDEPRDHTLQQRSDAPSRLFGLSLSDAFRQFVLEDPEVSALGKIIVEQERQYVEVFRDGQYPGPFIDFCWPLDVSASDLVFQFVRPVVFLVPGPPLPKGSEAVHRVASALAEKLQSLRRMLTSGQIVAHGTFVNTGMFGPINRLQWARSGLSIDVKSGDLLQEANNRATVQWSGLALEAPATSEPANQTVQGAKTTRAEVPPPETASAAVFHVNSTEHDGLRSRPISGKDAPAICKITPHHASIEAAIVAIWPEGIPTALPLKTRDQKIIDWQKENALAVASSKTIRRNLAAKAKSS